jgi:hypothetical protein
MSAVIQAGTEPGYSAFAHLAWILGGGRYGMFTCYCDEAGGADHGFVVVCGYIGTVDSWRGFEREWNITLAQFGVPYLHMLEFAHSTGPFQKWKGDAKTRADFMSELTGIIRNTAERGFLCKVSYADFAAVDRDYLLRKTVHSPYAMAARFVIAMANNVVRARGHEPSAVQYVFEAGHSDAAGLLKVAQRSGPNPMPLPVFKYSRDTPAEKGLVQLQAADHFAYELRKAIVDHPDAFTRAEEFRKSFQAIFPVRVDQGNYGESELRQFCVDARIPPR